MFNNIFSIFSNPTAMAQATLLHNYFSSLSPSNLVYDSTPAPQPSSSYPKRDVAEEAWQRQMEEMIMREEL